MDVFAAGASFDIGRSCISNRVYRLYFCDEYEYVSLE